MRQGVVSPRTPFGAKLGITKKYTRSIYYISLAKSCMKVGKCHMMAIKVLTKVVSSTSRDERTYGFSVSRRDRSGHSSRVSNVLWSGSSRAHDTLNRK